MRLSRIWTLPSMSTMERLRRTQKWATMEAARNLPKGIKEAVILLNNAEHT